MTVQVLSLLLDALPALAEEPQRALAQLRLVEGTEVAQPEGIPS